MDWKSNARTAPEPGIEPGLSGAQQWCFHNERLSFDRDVKKIRGLGKITVSFM